MPKTTFGGQDEHDERADLGTRLWLQESEGTSSFPGRSIRRSHGWCVTDRWLVNGHEHPLSQRFTSRWQHFGEHRHRREAQLQLLSLPVQDRKTQHLGQLSEVRAEWPGEKGVLRHVLKHALQKVRHRKQPLRDKHAHPSRPCSRL